MPYQCDPCVCPEQHYRDSMSWRKAMITLLCRVIGYVSGATPPTTPTPVTEAVFTPLASESTIGAAYTSVAVLPAGTREFILDNQTNGDVVVSMDGGVSDTYPMKGGDKLVKNLYTLGLTSGADIQIKDGTSPSNSGTFYVESIAS